MHNRLIVAVKQYASVGKSIAAQVASNSNSKLFLPGKIAGGGFTSNLGTIVDQRSPQALRNLKYQAPEAS